MRFEQQSENSQEYRQLECVLNVEKNRPAEDPGPYPEKIEDDSQQQQLEKAKEERVAVGVKKQVVGNRKSDKILAEKDKGAGPGTRPSLRFVNTKRTSETDDEQAGTKPKSINLSTRVAKSLTPKPSIGRSSIGQSKSVTSLRTPMYKSVGIKKATINQETASAEKVSRSTIPRSVNGTPASKISSPAIMKSGISRSGSNVGLGSREKLNVGSVKKPARIARVTSTIPKATVTPYNVKVDKNKK